MTTQLEPRLSHPRTNVQTAASITLALGIWYIFAPWVLGAAGHAPNVWNNIIVGILVAIFAGARLRTDAGAMPWAAWADAVLGIWVFCSPWIYGYVGVTNRFVDSLCVGAVIFLLALWSESSRRMPSAGAR